MRNHYNQTKIPVRQNLFAVKNKYMFRNLFVTDNHGGIYFRLKGSTGGLASGGLSMPASDLDVGELSWDFGECVRLGGAPDFEGQAM